MAALEFNQSLRIRNPYADVLEFTLTAHYEVSNSLMRPIDIRIMPLHGYSQLFHSILCTSASHLGRLAICTCRDKAALQEMSLLIEELQLRIKEFVRKETGYTDLLNELRSVPSKAWSECSSTPLADIQAMRELTESKTYGVIGTRSTTQGEIDLLNSLFDKKKES